MKDISITWEEKKARAVLNSQITAYRIERDTGISKNTIISYRNKNKVASVKNLNKLSAYYDALELEGYTNNDKTDPTVRALPKRGAYFDVEFYEKVNYTDFGF